MTTCLGKSCSFGEPHVRFINCCQFMYLVLLVLRAGYGIWLYQFLIIVYLFTFQCERFMLGVSDRELCWIHWRPRHPHTWNIRGTLSSTGGPDTLTHGISVDTTDAGFRPDITDLLAALSARNCSRTPQNTGQTFPPLGGVINFAQSELERVSS